MKERIGTEWDLTPDGKAVISGGTDGTIRIWDADKDSVTFGQQLGEPLSSHQAPVLRLAISPDGESLVSADESGKTLLWDISTRRSKEVLVHGSSGEGVSVAWLHFRPDGKKLIVVLRDSKILELDLNIESWQAKACRRANRNLTQEEWGYYFGEQPYRATCPQYPSALD